MCYQILLSPQVKRWAIVTYKHSIYELPHKRLKTWDLRRGALKLIFKEGTHFVPVIKIFT